jgi:hypothetical protein
MKQLLLLFTLFIGIQGFSQTNVYQENFETDANGTNYNTSIAEFLAGGDDYFTRTDGSDLAGSVQINGTEGSFFFGAQDIDGEGATLPVTLSTAQIDVTGLSNLDLAVLLAEDSELPDLDWDNDDYVHFTYTLDSGAPQNLLWIESNELIADGNTNDEASIDTDFDGVGDGQVLTDALTEFSAGFDVSGATTLEIQVEFQLDSGDEDIAMDNLRVVDGFTATPSLTVQNPSDGETFPPGTTQVDVEFTTANTSAGDQVNIDVNGTVAQDISSPFDILQTTDGQTYNATLDLVSGGNVVDSQTISFDIGTIISVASITDLRADVAANGLGGFYEITGASTLTMADGFNNRKWFQDGTPTGLYVEDGDAVIPNDAYVIGDQVSGLKGFTQDSNGVLTFVPTEDSGSVTGNVEVNPLILSLADFNANIDTYESVLVGFQNVSFTNSDGTITFDTGSNYEFSDGNETSDIRTEFYGADYIDDVIPTGNLEGLVGLAAEFNGNTQIYSRTSNDIDITLSTDAFQNIDVNLYPNPVSNGEILIDNQLNGDVEISLYTMSGKRVISQALGRNDKLDVSSLNSGVYLLQLVNGSTKATEKIIVK